MSVRVVESLVRPRTAGTLSGDALFTADDRVVVIDTSTPKPWEPRGPALEDVLAGTRTAVLGARSGSAADVLEALDRLLGELKSVSAEHTADGLCLTASGVDVATATAWRFGDHHLLVDGRPVPRRSTAEQTVADARALVLRGELIAGASPEHLLADDPGRRAVEPLLRALTSLRNRSDHPGGYPAIDGGGVVGTFIEEVGLDRGVEVVLATDGYVSARASLAATESELATRLAHDPLSIGPPATTKGAAPGVGSSYDDRAYVRIVLPSP